MPYRGLAVWAAIFVCLALVSIGEATVVREAPKVAWLFLVLSAFSMTLAMTLASWARRLRHLENRQPPEFRPADPASDLMSQKYAAIAERAQALTAICPGSSVTSEPVAGYVVALRHPAHVTAPLTEFSRRLSEVARCIRYTAENAHTTLAVTGEMPRGQFVPDTRILGQLGRAVAAVPPEVLGGIVINFGCWLLTTDAVIAAGYPTSPFWQAARRLRVAAAQEGLVVRMPWAAHMTAARFTEPQEGAAIPRLRELVAIEPGLGQSRPVGIIVGWYECSRDGFEIHPAAGDA